MELHDSLHACAEAVDARTFACRYAKKNFATRDLFDSFTREYFLERCVRCPGGACCLSRLCWLP